MRMLLAVLAVLACGCLAPRKSASTLQKAVAAADAGDAAIGGNGVDATDEDVADQEEGDAPPLADLPDLSDKDMDDVDDAAPPDAFEVSPDGDTGKPDIADVAGCPPSACDDGDPCTDDGCDLKLGCTHSANTEPCDDGNPCTGADACSKGKCAGSPQNPAVSCDDGNACTTDVCDAKGVCTHSNAADGGACTSPDGCAASAACQAGKCMAGGDKLFSATFGGSGDDVAFALTALADGGVAMAGYTVSTDLPGGQKSAGDTDLWLARADAGGKLLWNKTFGGTGGDQARALTALQDGGLASAGFTGSTDLPGGQKNAGSTDAWLVRTDGGGKLLWTQTYGGSKDDYGFALTALADGGLALAGMTNSTDLPGSQKSTGGNDFWLMRTDASGKLLWNQTFGGSGADGAVAVIELADSGLMLAGNSASSDLPGGQKSAGSNDLWLVRTDAGGKLLWNQTYGGSGEDQAGSLTVLADGGLVLAGHTLSTDLPGGQKTAGGWDLWLVRTDAAGKLLWNQTYGGSGNDQAPSTSGLADGGLVLAGYTASTDLPGGQKSSGSNDFWLVRIDAGGKLIWNWAYGGNGNDIACGLAVLPDGGLATAGFTNSADLPGGQKNAGKSDAWLIRTDPWGHATCAQAGVCAGKKVVDCDDKNACTADLCDATKGCTHTSLPDGSICGGGKTCTGGACM